MADLKGFKQGEQGRSAPVNEGASETKAAAISIDSLGLKNPAFWYSGGFIVAFVLMAIFAEARLAKIVEVGFAWSVKIFGPFWQILLLATFVIALAVGAGRTGRVILGNLPVPEIDSFKWMAILFCTLLAGGGVFWAAAEPIAHFVSAPPLYGESADLQQRAFNALSQSFMHWGFLAWSIVGSLTAIVIMHLHYDKGLPLKPRTLLYPMFGERVLTGQTGAIIDACCIVAVAAGTIGPIGFLGLQTSYALNTLFGIPDTFTTQLIIIVFAIVLYTLSAISGLSRGMQLLSRFNVILAFALMVFILLFGPTNFIVNGYIQGVGTMIDNFVPMATFRGDEGWLSWWTVFFWGWFLGYGPMMAIFIARISRGRTIRQLITTVCIIAPLVTCFWFTVVGGSGLAFEIANPGSVSSAFEGFNLPGALLAVTQQLPFPLITSILFLILTTVFIVTTGDSMTYTISVVISGEREPNAMIRTFWGIMMGVTAIVLISLGSGGVSALQSFIVITAVPVSFVLLPSLWNGPQIAQKMAREQDLYRPNKVEVRHKISEEELAKASTENKGSTEKMSKDSMAQKMD
ncbi:MULTISPECIES: BCCT family transporter [unclassified Psychrobacter]|uniref:BCCT family transporter n=1 Tax=unclassified Psychrobacter TaxID=196806 RepID=UPI0025B4703A|nr:MULTISPECIES: BCCT family transporter [unclassified Psychrobacter]MDN3453790.1 BCCT family transporter [Psychrobacter sp. APC 3350]MDN3503050.1 BCCT family transporter [Psychrobacter sp. 5A.1]